LLFSALIRRPPLGVCRVKPAVLLSCWCCTVVLLYCCTAVLCCIYTTVVVNRGQGLRTPTSAPFRPIPLIPPNSTPFEETQVFTRANGHHLPPPALLLLQACCRGYAAGAMPQGLCCTCSNCCTGHTDRHAPTDALATHIGMLQLLHWPHRSARSNCCTGHTDQHAPRAALAPQIGMLQVLHWPHGSACSNCCTGHTDRHAPTAALATQINMPQVLHWPPS